LVGVSGVTGSDTSNCKGEAQRKVGGIAVGSEANLATRENVHELKGRVSSRFPSFPDSKRSLPFVDVAGSLNAVFSVNLVSTVAAIAAYDAIKPGSDCGNGVLRFAKDPNLDHVARFPVV
jgi:hypothetical protein